MFQQKITYLFFILIIGFACLKPFKGLAQAEPMVVEETTVFVDSVPEHSPRMATLLSTALPGAGQFYNKKYWKIPVIYAIGGGLLYLTVNNNKNYNDFRQAYSYQYKTGNSKAGFEMYSKEQLKIIKDEYRRDRDLCIVGLTLLYVLNIVDATVDAHLFDYDISDDLSLRVQPDMLVNNFTSQQHFGLRFSIQF